MAEDLYDTDILAWSLGQADRLRRMAAGERVNDVDWSRVVEEIEDVGKSELRAVQSLLRRAIEHALKAAAMPHDDAARHWRHEAATFLRDAQDAYQPGMAQHVDLPLIWTRARRTVLELNGLPPEALSDRPPAIGLDALMDPDDSAVDLLRALAHQLT